MRPVDTETAIIVLAAQISTLQRFVPKSKIMVLAAQGNLANGYCYLRRYYEGLRLYREIYAGQVALLGQTHEDTILTGANMATALSANNCFGEGKQLTRELLQTARQSLDERHELSIELAHKLALILTVDPAKSRADLLEAEVLYVDTIKTARQALGPLHPQVRGLTSGLARTRRILASSGPSTGLA